MLGLQDDRYQAIMYYFILYNIAAIIWIPRLINFFYFFALKPVCIAFDNSVAMIASSMLYFLNKENQTENKYLCNLTAMFPHDAWFFQFNFVQFY